MRPPFELAKSGRKCMFSCLPVAAALSLWGIAQPNIIYTPDFARFLLPIAGAVARRLSYLGRGLRVSRCCETSKVSHHGPGRDQEEVIGALEANIYYNSVPRPGQHNSAACRMFTLYFAWEKTASFFRRSRVRTRVS